MASAQETLFGKPASTEYRQESLISPEQQAGLSSAITGLQGATSQQVGAYQSGGVDAKTFAAYKGQYDKFTDPQQLSLKGLEGLSKQQAGIAAQVGPDVQALRKIGAGAATPYSARLQQTVAEAQKALGEADIANRRGGGLGALYGSSRQTALRAMGEQYATTVGGAAARAVEESNLQRQQLAMQAYGQAGQMGLGSGQIQMQGAGQYGQLALGREQLGQRDLAGIRQAQLQQGLGLSQIGAQDVWNQNQYGMQTANLYNQFAIDRLKTLGQVSGQQTVENIVTQTPATEGIMPSLIQAGGMIGAAAFPPAGAALLAAQAAQAERRRQQQADTD